MEWYDWVAIGLSFAAGLLAGSVAGFVTLRESLRQEGYAVESLKDARGKWRWRVGVREEAEEVRPVQRVRWIAPKGGTDGG